MQRLIGTTTVLGLLAILAFGAAGADDSTPSIKQVMKTLNKGENCLCKELGKDLKASSVNWTDLQPKTKKFVTLAEAMSKGKPPRGEQTSWDRLCKEYVQEARDMDQAAQRMDQAGAAKAQ